MILLAVVAWLHRDLRGVAILSYFRRLDNLWNCLEHRAGMFPLLALLAGPRFETIFRTLWMFPASASTFWVLASDAIVLPVDVRVVLHSVQRSFLTRFALRKPAFVAHPTKVVTSAFEPFFLIPRAEVTQMLLHFTGVTGSGSEGFRSEDLGLEGLGTYL